MKTSYFELIRDVFNLMGKPVIEGKDMINDPNWFGCWDDGMTPEDSVREYNEFMKDIEK
jgi:hypothetical protein